MGPGFGPHDFTKPRFTNVRSWIQHSGSAPQQTSKAGTNLISQKTKQIKWANNGKVSKKPGERENGKGRCLLHCVSRYLTCTYSVPWYNLLPPVRCSGTLETPETSQPEYLARHWNPFVQYLYLDCMFPTTLTEGFIPPMEALQVSVSQLDISCAGKRQNLPCLGA